MRRLINFLFLFMVSFSFSLVFSLSAKAEEGVEFRVQTTELSADGEIEVKVYINDIEHIGGADLELQYDSEQVSYIDGGLGETVSCAYYDVYHNQEKNLIKYVLLLPSMQDTDEAFLKATFKLAGTEGDEPSFRVVDLVDDTDEIADVDYKIMYQQADGTWTEADEGNDTVVEEGEISTGSGEASSSADDVLETSTANGAENIKKTEDVVKDTSQNQTENSLINNNSQENLKEIEDTTVESKEKLGSENLKEQEAEKKVEEQPKAVSKKTTEKEMFFVIIGMLVVFFAFYKWRRKKKSREKELNDQDR